MAQKIKIAFILLVLLSLVFLAVIVLPKPLPGPEAFFAYGASLEFSTMRARAGGFANETPAALLGYRLVFQTNRHSEFGVANIVPDENSQVPGAVYFLSGEQAMALDGNSGSPGFYRKIPVTVTASNGSTINAVTYALSGSPTFAPPALATMQAASKGLQQFGYAKSEQDKLAAAAAEAAQKKGNRN